VRAISEVLATLIMVGIAVGAAVALAAVLGGVLSPQGLGQAGLMIYRAQMFRDPTNPAGTTYILALGLQATSPGQANVDSVYVVHQGQQVRCQSITYDVFPAVLNRGDVVYFYAACVFSSPPSPGSRVLAVLEYRTGGAVKAATAEVTVS